MKNKTYDTESQIPADVWRTIIVQRVHSMMMLHEGSMITLRSKREDEFDKVISEIKESFKKGLRVFAKDDLAEMKSILFDVILANKYANILEASLQSGNQDITMSDILGFMEECRRVRLYVDYCMFASLAIQYFPSEVTKERIAEWLNKAELKGVFEAAVGVVLALIDSRLSFNSGDVMQWMEMFTPGMYASGMERKEHWEQYAAIALHILEGCERVPGVDFTVRYQNMEGIFTSDDISDWIRRLKAANRFDLAARLEIEAFIKGFDGTDSMEVSKSIEAVDLPVELLTELRALVIEQVPDELMSDGLVSREDIRRWGNEATGYYATPNAYKTPVGAIHRGMARSEDIEHWVPAFYKYFAKYGRQHQGVEIAKAALNIRKETNPGITHEVYRGIIADDVVSWMKQCSQENAQEIMCATLRSDLGPEIPREYIRELCREYAEIGKSQYLSNMALAALEAGNHEITHEICKSMSEYYKYEGKALTDSNMIIDILFSLDVSNGAASLFALACNTGDVVGITRDDVDRWANYSVKWGMPLQAVAIGVAAQDAGIDVPEETVQAWQSACYDGKSPEEVASIARALTEVYQHRPTVQKLSVQQQEALERDVNKAYETVMQHQEALGITVMTPLNAAIGKIDAMIFREM